MQLTDTTHALGLRAAATSAWGMARHHHASHSTGIGVARDAFDVAARSTDSRVRALAREAVVGVVKAQLTWGTTAVPHWYAAAGALQRAAEVQEAVAPAYAGRVFRDRLVPADARDARLHAKFPQSPRWRSTEWFDAMADCARHAASLAAAADGVGARSHALRSAQAGIAALSPQFSGAAYRGSIDGILALFDAVTARADAAVTHLLAAADSFEQVAMARRSVQE